jgi:hypothetical protein
LKRLKEWSHNYVIPSITSFPTSLAPLRERVGVRGGMEGFRSVVPSFNVGDEVPVTATFRLRHLLSPSLTLFS